MTLPFHKWTLLRIAIFGILGVVLLAAALAQSQQPSVKPSSQGTVQGQSAPQPTPSPTPAQTPPPQNPPAQSPPPASPPPASGGTLYTAPDGSASVIVPAGWKVIQATESLIVLNGPNLGEGAVLGKIINAHNAPYVPGQKGADNTGMSMPYAATFQEKVEMAVEQLVLQEGNPIPTGAVTSVAPIPVPPDLGQCGAYSGNLNGARGQFVAAGSFCAMPLENLGDYKTILNIVQLPVSESANLVPVTQSIMGSYNVPVNALEVLLKPFDQVVGHEVLMNPVSSQCFQIGVMHLTPIAQIPRACGGTAP